MAVDSSGEDAPCTLELFQTRWPDGEYTMFIDTLSKAQKTNGITLLVVTFISTDI